MRAASTGVPPKLHKDWHLGKLVLVKHLGRQCSRHRHEEKKMTGVHRRPVVFFPSRPSPLRCCSWCPLNFLFYLPNKTDEVAPRALEKVTIRCLTTPSKCCRMSSITTSAQMSRILCCSSAGHRGVHIDWGIVQCVICRNTQAIATWEGSISHQYSTSSPCCIQLVH